jgi:glutathione S-transferase
MMILRSAPASPFARKVRIAANVLGCEQEITVQPADVLDPNDTVRKQNPLGKIPVLVTEDGSAIYDSRVILEYLDHRAGGGRILPLDWSMRLAALRLQALCDGILDAAILQVYEARWRAAEHHEPKWVAHQSDKVARGLAALDAMSASLDGTPDVGQIALACTLGYLDFRFAGRWRDRHAGLVTWLNAFAAKIPCYEATKPN